MCRRRNGSGRNESRSKARTGQHVAGRAWATGLLLPASLHPLIPCRLACPPASQLSCQCNIPQPPLTTSSNRPGSTASRWQAPRPAAAASCIQLGHEHVSLEIFLRLQRPSITPQPLPRQLNLLLSLQPPLTPNPGPPAVGGWVFKWRRFPSRLRSERPPAASCCAKFRLQWWQVSSLARRMGSCRRQCVGAGVPGRHPWGCPP